MRLIVHFASADQFLSFHVLKIIVNFSIIRELALIILKYYILTHPKVNLSIII